jgi:hypothetical protein
MNAVGIGPEAAIEAERRAPGTTLAGCVGDGLGDPSTCQRHMAAWPAGAPVCDAVLAEHVGTAHHADSTFGRTYQRRSGAGIRAAVAWARARIPEVRHDI